VTYKPVVDLFCPAPGVRMLGNQLGHKCRGRDARKEIGHVMAAGCLRLAINHLLFTALVRAGFLP